MKIFKDRVEFNLLDSTTNKPLTIKRNVGEKQKQKLVCIHKDAANSGKQLLVNLSES